MYEPGPDAANTLEDSKTQDTGTGKISQFVSEERLKVKVEQAILETHSQILRPCSSKNKILALLLTLENLFLNNQKLQQAATKQKPPDPEILQ